MFFSGAGDKTVMTCQLSPNTTRVDLEGIMGSEEVRQGKQVLPDVTHVRTVAARGRGVGDERNHLAR